MLEPEIIEAVAGYIACPETWFAFLSALPSYALRPPLQSQLRLYPAVLPRGPRLVLHKISPEHVADIRTAMALYSTVELADWSAPSRNVACVGGTADVAVSNVKSLAALEVAVRSWPMRLIGVKLDVGPEALFSAAHAVAASHLLRDTCPNLASLDVCWQRPVEPAEQDALVTCICASKLAHLRLASFMTIVMSDDNTRRLAAWMRSAPLASVVFESVAFAMQSEALVCHALRRQAPALTSLKLAFTSSLARALLNGRRLPRTLPSLEIVGSIETVDVAPSMAAMMAESLADSKLTHCTLSSNHCLHNPEVACLLLGALPHMTDLVYLNLTYNGLDTLACEVLAAHLPKIPQLQTLNLENNFLRDVGAAIIATALPHCATLTTLHLGHNFIGDVGVRALCMAVPGCRRLSTLTLGGNDVTAIGAAQLAKMVQVTSTLTTLDVALNPHLQADGVLRLLNGLHASPQRVQLTVSGRSLPPKQLRKCQSLIEQLDLPATLLL
ncbi:hypothetical protein ACHHYP_12488 [Achlya hypogyna]|uniref:Uncharacterized protein n=1 Tax=Achlya hypogyna TaxID=1202772 RepID=A0A1V9YGW3_ACHHY|nr:hypothetical protein ACHHYP_12488 [Achlya hypogyna]